MPVDWKGDKVATKVARAAALAIDQTTAACVAYAKENHPWTNRTATLEGSLRMKSATAQGARVVGEWGSWTVDYAIYLEIGTERMDAMPYLSPASAVEYPKLASRIAEVMEE